MAHSEHFNQRVHEIGQEIFERALSAQPRFWQRSWWLEQATHWVDQNEQLKTRAFQFVDCLPSLKSNTAITRHLSEYLSPQHVDLPKLFFAATGEGPLKSTRETIIGEAARYGARQMAGRFITGYDIPSAIKTIERLRRQHMAFTIDVLGESTTSYAQADRYANVYHDLIERLSRIACGWAYDPVVDEETSGPMPRVNLSIKLSSLDPHCDAIDPERAINEMSKRLVPLLCHARETGAFVNIDMESYKHRLLTLELFKRVMMQDEFCDWTQVGIVLQAYLKEGEGDLRDLLEWGKQRGTRFAIRLVKGAYWDAETAVAVRHYVDPPVWTRKWESDACYERMTCTMLDHAHLIRPAFASHNVRSLAVVIAAAKERDISRSDYELQTLYGMGDPLKAALVRMRQCVRVYCPYGELMSGMAYLIRRLLENTSNDGFLKQSFTDRGTHARLLTDPDLARPPSAALPKRHYQDLNLEEAMVSFTNASNTNFALAENRAKMKGALEYVRGELGRSYPCVINHESVTTEEWFESHNPSHGPEVIGRVACATTSDVDRAVAAARKAFASWSHKPASERADLLWKTADRIEMRRFELAATMILEAGKPWREADADVTEAIDHCRYYAEQIEHIDAHPRLRNLPGENNTLVYMPKGVCAVVSPWSFPLAILTGMTTAALAAGDTVVLKPARQASVTAAKLMEILQDVGVPAGVVNFLPGFGETIGRYLVEHEDVNIVAFTGSAAVGTEVLAAGSKVRPGQPFIRKMIVEMGGKNAVIIDDDADVDSAVQAVVESAFACAGQKCSSCSRLIVLEGVYDNVCHRLKEAVESLTIGPAQAPATLTGPVIDEHAAERIRQAIDDARTLADVLVEATLPPECEAGYFVPPTVLTHVDPDAFIAQEEILGPVLVVLKAKDFDEAVKIANGTRYALTGGVFSRSPLHIQQARREFHVGNLYINRKITGSQVDAQPFGGYQLSGTGVKAGSPDYLLHFMDARCITENTLRSGLVPTKEETRGLETGN